MIILLAVSGVEHGVKRVDQVIGRSVIKHTYASTLRVRFRLFGQIETCRN